MRPIFRLLSDELIDQILTEARDILCNLGVKLQNDRALDLLAEHGARVDRATQHVWFTDALIDQALATSPASFQLFDVLGEPAVDLGGHRVNFTPGSAAINLLDPETQQLRRPVTADYLRSPRTCPNACRTATACS
ncbi:MAG: trimethylamine methyltransferase family protein [Deltaproteobacteria bacterium]|nr:trimethylamine methyltransferase family protein [Deltaproteobacteria bacterium]